MAVSLSQRQGLLKGQVKHVLAFTRYCYSQYCMVYGIHKGVRVGVVYCPITVQWYCNSVGNAGGPEECKDD